MQQATWHTADREEVGERELGAWRLNSSLVVVWQLDCLTMDPCAPTGGTRVPFSDLTNVEQDHTRTGTRPAVGEPNETGLELTAEW